MSPAGRVWVDGLWHRNPALVQLLGLCPLLAVSNSLVTALALSTATLATLLVSNVSISLLRHRVPPPVRLPLQILVIATTVTVIETALAGWLPVLHASLGIFLPLIVTNCLILGRAESVARHVPPVDALRDALAIGTGFALVLVLLGAVRELIGRGTLLADAASLFGDVARDWELRVFDAEHGILLALLPPGAFLLLGLMLAVRNLLDPPPEK